ncbi:ABC transporter substrate-binding protein [Rhizobium leguminosarum]|uniref:ABC transporter substrate-binding protein n=1 Tax=Rhizobium leguminosarum TaxID=384 RepID=UPI000483A3A8|nr:ABC transporter substrate-binding protein [Rhizobium leguminosarum]WFT89510.1 ABC transporter substrate-binding protein [Rhizobium leguminosarum]
MLNRAFFRIAVVGTVLSALSSTSFADDIPIIKEVKDSGKLTIASSLGYAPFEYIDEQGKPVGLDIELATAVAELLNAKLDIVTIPFASQIPGLAAGRIKVGWATFSVTEERLKQADFVTFMQAGTVVATTRDNKKKFAAKNSLCGAKVAVQSGTSADFAADKLDVECKAANLPALNKAIYPEQKDTIQAVLSGRAEARLDDSTSAGYYEVTSKGKLIVTGDSFYPTPLGVVIAKGDKETAAMLEAALQKLISNGTYSNILKKYNMTTSSVEKPTIYTDAAQLAQ